MNRAGKRSPNGDKNGSAAHRSRSRFGTQNYVPPPIVRRRQILVAHTLFNRLRSLLRYKHRAATAIAAALTLPRATPNKRHNQTNDTIIIMGIRNLFRRRSSKAAPKKEAKSSKKVMEEVIGGESMSVAYHLN
jgi:hypothetical protein